MSNAKQLLYPLLLSTAIATSAFAGGIGSGGGNTLPPNLITPQEVQRIASPSVAGPILRLYLNSIENGGLYFPELEAPQALPKLFNGARTIHDVIRTTGIYVNMEGPCFDKDGNPMDGSTIAPIQNHICISAFSISKKLSVLEGFHQVVGLIAHEFSHLLGATELEAEVLQARVVWQLTYGYVDLLKASEIKGRILEVHKNLQLLSIEARRLSQQVELLRPEELRDRVRSLYRYALDTRYVSESFPGIEFSRVALNNWQANQARIKTLAWNYCLNDKDDWHNRSCQERLDRVFAGNRYFVDYPTWLSRTSEPGYYGIQIQPPGFWIRKIRTVSDLKTELETIALETLQLSSHVEDTLYGYYGSYPNP